ncbi:hypothetical protein LGT40_11230 [Methylophaga sp. TMB456]|nr:hypothetical protein [Methylophaga pinxianii]
MVFDTLWALLMG